MAGATFISCPLVGRWMDLSGESAVSSQQSGQIHYLSSSVENIFLAIPPYLSIHVKPPNLSPFPTVIKTLGLQRLLSRGERHTQHYFLEQHYMTEKVWTKY